MVSEIYLRGPLCHLDWPSAMKTNDLSKGIWESRNNIILFMGAPKLCVSLWFPTKNQESES